MQKQLKINKDFKTISNKIFQNRHCGLPAALGFHIEKNVNACVWGSGHSNMSTIRFSGAHPIHHSHMRPFIIFHLYFVSVLLVLCFFYLKKKKIFSSILEPNRCRLNSYLYERILFVPVTLKTSNPTSVEPICSEATLKLNCVSVIRLSQKSDSFVHFIAYPISTLNCRRIFFFFFIAYHSSILHHPKSRIFPLFSVIIVPYMDCSFHFFWILVDSLTPDACHFSV